MTALRRLAAATVLAAAAVLAVGGPAHAGVPAVEGVTCPPQAPRPLCEIVEDVPNEDTPWG